MSGIPSDEPAQKLTPKQEKFCAEYIDTGNASEAYRRAYNASKMKPETINRRAFDLLENSKIKARLSIYLDEIKASPQATLQRLLQGQEFDIRKLYRSDGTLKMPHELDENTAKAIVGVKHDADGNLVEYKVIDVKGCAELMGKHFKLFTDKMEVSGTMLVKNLKGVRSQKRGKPDK